MTKNFPSFSPKSGKPDEFTDQRSVRWPGGVFAFLPRWFPNARRLAMVLCSVVVVCYSIVVLWLVATMGDIGVRCVFGTVLTEEIDPAVFEWSPVDAGLTSRPGRGDRLLQVGPPSGGRVEGRGENQVVRIERYPDYVQSLRMLRHWYHIGAREVEVQWEPKTAPGTIRAARASLRDRPEAAWIRSFLWFLQELVIFALGAWVTWRRPKDEPARVFFWLCLVTVGAYMGGYHWSVIVISPILIYMFAAFALFVPIVSLHFYLVFPRHNPLFQKFQIPATRWLYGFPSTYLLVLWSSLLWLNWIKTERSSRVDLALTWVRSLALGYIFSAAAIYAACIVCLYWSFRSAASRRERNQVKWILWASLLAAIPIAIVLVRAFLDAAALGQELTAWLMFAVSLLYTCAYAMSITRFKLLQVEEILNRSVIYVAVSVSAGLLYSGALVISTLLIGDQLLVNQPSRQAMVVGVVAIGALILTGAVRERFQKVIDRRFFREKYKFDKAMHQMSLAVDRLLDRSTLGKRLLDAATEVLPVEWGAIYFAAQPGDAMTLGMFVGPSPEQRTLDAANPLLDRLAKHPLIYQRKSISFSIEQDPTYDSLITLGGEVALALHDPDQRLIGAVILGPKQSGLPFEDEELAFLSALGSVATLALHSADVHQTLDDLNQELRAKVEKIAEQQRRILLLQDQLMDRRDPDSLAIVGDSANPLSAEPPPSEDANQRQPQFDFIKGSSRVTRELLGMVRKVAGSNSAVLIRGESGTGKELFAEAIHRASPRREGPFVKVHCAALSQSLLESELFGHTKGAFTGADRDRVGRFQQADGGTLFLDEIGDINLEVQIKLLRVLQEKSFERVGSSQSQRVDARIIAATHQDLEGLIQQGKFREDLFYRLNVIPLFIPSLRDRPDDIFELAVHFLHVHAAQSGKQVARIEHDAIECLMNHDWPGNVRELENVIERAVVLAEGGAITLADLADEIRRSSSARRSPWGRSTRRPTLARSPAAGGVAPPSSSRPARTGSSAASSARVDSSEPEDLELEDYQKSRLLDALEQANGNKSEAARLLGIPRSTLFSQLRKHGLSERSGDTQRRPPLPGVPMGDRGT